MPFAETSLMRRFFAGLTENTFQTQLGVVDPPLVDYLTDLLTRFVEYPSIYRIRDVSGKPLRGVVEMLAEAEERVGAAKRELHRHIGDFTLFWTGVYPEALRHVRDASRADLAIDYGCEGKKSYWIASTIAAEEVEGPTAEVLARLSRQFDLCAYGLREIRRLWEDRDEGPPSRPLLIN